MPKGHNGANARDTWAGPAGVHEITPASHFAFCLAWCALACLLSMLVTRTLQIPGVSTVLAIAVDALLIGVVKMVADPALAGAVDFGSVTDERHAWIGYLAMRCAIYGVAFIASDAMALLLFDDGIIFPSPGYAFLCALAGEFAYECLFKMPGYGDAGGTGAGTMPGDGVEGDSGDVRSDDDFGDFV